MKFPLQSGTIKVAVVAFTMVLSGSPRATADGASWFFNQKDQKAGTLSNTFGFASGNSDESVPVFGECEKGVTVAIYFEEAALADLIRSEAYPWINFVIDGENHKFPIEQLQVMEAGAKTWVPKIGSGLEKEFFQKLATAKKVMIQLLGNEKIFDTYKPSTDHGRKNAMLSVAKECF